MEDKKQIKQLSKNIPAIIIGIFIGSIIPLATVFDRFTGNSYKILHKIFFLTDLNLVWGQFATTFIIFFIAGFVTAKICKNYRLISATFVGMIVPIISPFILSFIITPMYFYGSLINNIILFGFYSFLGGLIYVKFSK